MLWLLLILHVGAIALIGALGDRVGRRAFAIAAVPAAATTVWAAWLAIDDEIATGELSWVEGLDLTLGFRIDGLAAMMTLLVSGIGTLVFVYAAGYFSASATGVGRFAATLLAFATSMLGLVWADTVWALFLFWELTSITSFLLVGHKHVDAVARRAARRALFLTVSGGLALLAGFVLLVDAGGTARLSELSPATGTAATVGAVAILFAAATKSAQVPFHVWLPGAMVAPTPVSAYLHSATMVKAGVLLVAIAAPALASTDVWTPLGLAFGITSMIWGAVGALRHVDAKLILAWGTVSQLGLMITLLVLDDPKATLAGISMLLAHAVFKAALFMVVGEIDVRTGTRDIRDLGGLRHTMPVAFWVAVLSGASMAGIPPMLGFATKEAAVEAVIKLSGAELWVASIGVLGGSVLTVAYTGRLLIGLFGGPPRPEADEIAPTRVWLTAPSVVLTVITVVGFVLLEAVDELAGRAAAELDPRTTEFGLIRWPGFDSTALWFSTGIIVIGALMAVQVARRDGTVPRTVGADAVDGLLDGVLVVSRRVAATFQHGSLPIYVATMAATAAVATVPFAFSVDLDAIRRWDDPLQGVLAVVVVGAALAMVAVTTRLGAAIGLGAVGIGVAGIFVVHGAPDLALTQLLVETVIVVGFVVGLGRLARHFPTTGEMWRGVRIAVAGAAGLAVAVALASSAADPVAEPPVAELTEQAVDEGGGNNVVNVILTDIRALDTFGEIMVLVVVSIGIAALARANRREVTA